MRPLRGISLVIQAVLCSSLATGLTRGSHEVHEKRDGAPAFWTRISAASGNTSLDLRFALKQSNLDRADEFMRDVSHPQSENYGKFWSPEKVIATFAPSDDAVNATVGWLLQMGVSSKRISPSAGRNWIKVNSTVAEAQTLLQTTYSTYENTQGTTLVACESYALPSSIRQYIDFVSPTIQFDSRTGQVAKRGISKRDSLKFKVAAVNADMDPFSLDTCSQFITPACLRAMYNIPLAPEAAPGNTFGVVEFSPESFNQEDLNVFFSSLAPHVPNNTAPILDRIDGGFITNATGDFNRGESDLDLCIAMGLVTPQEVTLYQVGDGVTDQPATNNNFLDAIDGSYCTFEGGDDPAFDAIYPHNASDVGGIPFTGQPNCGTFKPTNVISVSYADNEAGPPISYRTRECMEYMKLGLMGVTVVFPAGDDGANGIDGTCLPEPGKPPVTIGIDMRFNPLFPSTCPWVTSVSATTLPANGTVGDQEVSATLFFAGGGFSNIFLMPEYQSEAIAAFYASHAPPFNASIYNNSQIVRGYPDIALTSQNFITGIDGGLEALSGSSASVPLFASMITLINGERIKAGKGPVGFLNPVLYAHPEIFGDVVEGHSVGCRTTGFTANEGWDPLSGLGTPKYDSLRDVLMGLP